MKNLIGQYGTKCIILGCGPTLKKLSPQKIEGLKKEYCIFAIKQAHNIAPLFTDFHFINDNNLSTYGYFPHTKRVVEYPRNNYRGGLRAGTSDYTFIVDQNTDYNKSLSATHSFSEWTLDKTLIRPWGPGIIYELVFYFAHYIGMKEIITIGWDLGPTASRDHFYNHSVTNPAAPLHPEEAKNEVNLTRGFYEWLLSQGISLKVESGSYVHESIPRITL